MQRRWQVCMLAFKTKRHRTKKKKNIEKSKAAAALNIRGPVLLRHAYVI